MVPKPSSQSPQRPGFLGAISLVLGTLLTFPALAILPIAFASATAALIKLALLAIPLARATENLPTKEPAKSLALLLIDSAAFAPIALLLPVFLVTAAVAVKTRWQYPQSTPGMFTFEFSRQWIRSIGLTIMTAIYALPFALVLYVGFWGISNFSVKLPFGNAIDFSLVVAAATCIALTVFLLAIRLLTSPFIAIANNLTIGQSFASASYVVTRRLTGLVLTLLLVATLVFCGLDALSDLQLSQLVALPAQLVVISYALWIGAALTQALCLQALDELSAKSMNLLRANKRFEEQKTNTQSTQSESGKLVRALAVGFNEFSDELPENFLREVGD